jgi:RHH-type proline utilization regulon transcriptional repressor/proline dehydrogenase/delta 1-pyrroline-5-carboxylate dehydrogenase
LQIIEAVAKDSALKNWDGFGLAIQAYQKRCLPLTEHLVDLARTNNRRMQIRLVKGAYWDTEVKRAQVMGLPEYPVYTRKTNTDLSYLACARVLLEARDAVYPMLATHNAHSIAAVLDLAGNDRSGFEFHRLHGMGETLHDLVLNDGSAKACVYAPCGSHEDLLPYLVRRLLENGANSSFVNKLLDPATPPEALAVDPVENARAHKIKRHPRIALPKNIYGERINSAGLDLTDTPTFQKLHDQIKSLDAVAYEAAPLIGGKVEKTGAAFEVKNPATGDRVGKVWNASIEQVAKAFETTRKGFPAWNAAPSDDRAKALEKFADLMEKNRAELMGLCVREAGKTLDDAQAEIREAVDFCRYYARQGRKEFDANGIVLPGPTGERNVMTLHGRGTFVCISPWNFPLAIFVGQIVAALMAGNAVIAKPAEQTPIIGFRAVQLMIEAGIPADAIALLTGDGSIGAAIVQHKDVAGVAFTGSTDVARIINRTLAAKYSAIVPLIAETGGQNAMIVDSSALPEQIVDDVITSAFGSTGQRCSALRVLYVQDDIAERVLTLLKGAMAERTVGNPIDLSTDFGPVIDAEALKLLQQHRSKMQAAGKLIAEVPSPYPSPLREREEAQSASGEGYFFAPVAFEISDIKKLEREIFGPVLHVIRFKASDIDRVIADVNATGYGLTFGAHTRISTTMKKLANAANAGHVYINRTMIGAVVGVQPFGGQGLSGTGPKAGGHHYLHRFATEKVVSTDTTRQGGNATLVSLEE